MKPASFTYLRPETVDEAVSALSEYGADARILAGGQSLMAMLNFRLVQTKVLIDISRIDALREIRLDGRWIEVGAAITQSEFLDWPDLRAHAPLIAQALPWVGHFQTRNRGTVCGSISHADPSSELPLCLALLQGEVVLRSGSGERRLKASEFQTGMLQTARRNDELVTAVRFPVQPGTAATAFREVSRRHGDFAIVAVGAIAEESGAIRCALGGVADIPARFEIAPGLNDSGIADRINELVWQLGGYDDIHASAGYRRDLVRRLAPAMITEIRACAA
jgi:2-furoyl-CoA dehydrogenase FAD binding subunit